MTRVNRIALLFIVTFISVPAMAGPAIQHWQTANGANVYFVPAPELPMVDVRVVFDAGSAREGDKWGLASLTNGLFAEGAGGKTAQELSEAFEDVGAQLDYGSLIDMAWVGVRTLTEQSKLDASLNALTTLLTKADFPQTAFEREQRRMLIGLEQKKQSPSAIAQDAFYEAIYGEHPYGHPMSGTTETVIALQREDLVDFYKTYYTAKNAVIAITGDVTRQQAESMADQLVNDLPVGKKPEKVPAVKTLTESKEIRIQHPSTQTTIIVGQPGMRRGDDDYFALYVGNHSLGGSGLVSRLSEEVREKRGLSYSVYSYFSPMAELGPFMSSMQTRNDQADEGVKVLKDTIRGYVVEGQTEEEFSSTIKNITGGFPMRIDSNRKIVEYLAMIGYYGLPLDYLDAFICQIEQLSIDDTRDAMRRRLDPDKMVTVIVGGAAE